MSHEGDAYWLSILAGTTAYDAWAMQTGHETASAAMRRYTEQPWQKYLLVGVLGGLAVHFLLPPINFERGNHETPQNG